MNPEKLISKLQMSPHPEGGYFKETYRSELVVKDLEEFDGERSCSTAIYFMLTKDSRSHLHRIKSDEIWHFYAGDPLRVVMISPEGEYKEQLVGSNLDAGEVFQFVVPAGCWFGSEVVSGGEYSLVGCTVAPGFDFKDFEMAKKETMLQLFPQHKDLVEIFCLS